MRTATQSPELDVWVSENVVSPNSSLLSEQDAKPSSDIKHTIILFFIFLSALITLLWPCSLASMTENPIKTLGCITVRASLNMPPAVFGIHYDFSSFFFQPFHKIIYTRNGHQFIFTSHYRIDRSLCYLIAITGFRITRYRHDGSEKTRISGSHEPRTRASHRTAKQINAACIHFATFCVLLYELPDGFVGLYSPCKRVRTLWYKHHCMDAPFLEIFGNSEYRLFLHLPHIVIATFGTAMQVNHQDGSLLSASGCDHSLPIRECDILVSPAFKRKCERWRNRSGSERNLEAPKEPGNDKCDS